jgi:hypothetical protein
MARASSALAKPSLNPACLNPAAFITAPTLHEFNVSRNYNRTIEPERESPGANQGGVA